MFLFVLVVPAYQEIKREREAAATDFHKKDLDTFTFLSN